MTPNRREFFKTAGSAAAGLVFTASQSTKAAQPGRQQTSGPKRRRVVVAGRRIKTVDIHAHCQVPDALELVKGYEWGDPLRTSLANRDFGLQLNLSRIKERIGVMDGWGIDVQALSINPFWYAAERAIATELINLQNERLAEVCSAHSDRFVGMATVALQFPDLAAQQLEQGVKRMGMRSCLIGGSVNGIELSARQFDCGSRKLRSD